MANDMSFEEYRDRCRAHGQKDEDIARTWELMESIQNVLDDNDISPFAAPETVLSKKARLARMFIDRVSVETRCNDGTIVKWLRSGTLTSFLPEQTSIALDKTLLRLSDLIADGAHWKWWHENKHRS